MEASINGSSVKGSGTILLVEDDEMVRTTVCFLLEYCGYQVLEACHGMEALSIYKSNHYKFDLVLTDVVMPGISARELVEEIKILNPAQQVPYTSGYTQEVVNRHGVDSEDINFLGKPFDLDGLAAKVYEVLNK